MNMLKTKSSKPLTQSNWLMATLALALLLIFASGLRAEDGAETVAETVMVAGEESRSEQVSAPPADEASSAAPKVTSMMMPPPAPASEAPLLGNTPAEAQPVVSNGARVQVDTKGFSIVPPEGWEVRRDVGNASVLVQAPKQAGIVYQRSVQVMAFKGPKFIDSTSAKEFEDLLVRKFSESSAAIEEYRIRNNTDIEMADGRKGILFYSEFKFDSVSMMQAHILVSSKSRHYITTYTDIAEHFEQEENQAYLAEAWGSMTSIELDSATPGRFEGPIMAGIAIFVASGFLGVFFLLRYRMARKRYEELSQSDLSNEKEVSSPQSALNSNLVTLSDSIHDEDDEIDGDGDGNGDDINEQGSSNVSHFSKPESRLGSQIDSQSGSQIDSEPDSRITGKAG